MKVRHGFVSNSSSSSFVCEICRSTETGFDLSPQDLGFVECENGHIFCEEHIINGDDGLHYDSKYNEYVVEKHCPICQFEEYSQPELARYLEKEYKVSRDQVFAEIKAINKRRKKLYDYEYIEYVFKLHNLNDDIMLESLKNTFKTYKNFNEYISK